MTGNLFESLAPSENASEWFTAHCDGGSRGNPGPSGYGAVVEDAKGQVVARLNRFLGVQTNKEADALANEAMDKGMGRTTSKPTG
jgi:ribonuclease HI